MRERRNCGAANMGDGRDDAGKVPGQLIGNEGAATSRRRRALSDPPSAASDNAEPALTGSIEDQLTLRLGFAACRRRARGRGTSSAGTGSVAAVGPHGHLDPISFPGHRHPRRVHPPSCLPSMRASSSSNGRAGMIFNYLECLVPRLASSDQVVVAITAAAASSPRFAEQLGHLEAPPNVRFDREVRTPDARMRVRFRAQLAATWSMRLIGIAPAASFCHRLTSRSSRRRCTRRPARAGRVRRLHLEAVLHGQGAIRRETAWPSAC